ncbi:MAG TPA: V-type ATP synthase subunit E [Clostridia bacterium]|nr:V-type ATP synthase subunit E [Clostridia bacterium]
MALEDILRRIEADSKLSCEQIIEEARRRAESIKKEAQDRANALKEEILKQGKAKAREQRDRILTIAALERRKSLLEAKQEGIRTALQRALGSFVEMPVDEYKTLIRDMLLGAASGTEQVIVSPRDHELLDEAFFAEVNEALQKMGKPGRLSLSPETRPMSGGVILASGQVEKNLSFDMTLSLIQDDLEPEVAGILYSD